MKESCFLILFVYATKRLKTFQISLQIRIVRAVFAHNRIYSIQNLGAKPEIPVSELLTS